MSDVAVVDQSWAGGEFDGMIPKRWIEANWRRFIYSPSSLQRVSYEQSQDMHHQGIYFLWADGKLLYVGLARDIAIRLEQHKAAGKIPFAEVSSFEAPGRNFYNLFLAGVEYVYIKGLTPPYNKHRGNGYMPNGTRIAKIIRRLWLPVLRARRATG